MNNRFIDKARGRRRQVRVRGYMRDRRMNDYGMDGRRGRRYDREMNDMAINDYRRNDYGDYGLNDYEMRGNDGHYGMHMGYYGRAEIMPDYNYGRRSSRRHDYADYNYDDDYEEDYAASGEEEYKKELHKWTSKLKQNDRFNINKEEIIKKAKEMQIKFEEFSEEEFYAIYLLMLNMYKNSFNDPHLYIKMAKDFLMYPDFKLNPSETVWVLLNDIVLGKEGE
jgi:hypothetical protein